MADDIGLDAGNINNRFIEQMGLDCAAEAERLSAAGVTLDLAFLVYLRRFARFGYFHFGPVTIDVNLVEEIVERTLPRAEKGEPSLCEDMVRFSHTLVAEVAASGRRRIDELHYLLALMRTKEGLPARVFSELGVTPEQVEEFARRGPGAPDESEKLYSPEDAAEYLGVHVQTVRAWIRAGRLRASRLAGQRALRIRGSDLQTLLEPIEPGDV